MRAIIYVGLAQMISSLANPCDQYCSSSQEVYAFGWHSVFGVCYSFVSRWQS